MINALPRNPYVIGGALALTAFAAVVYYWPTKIRPFFQNTVGPKLTALIALVVAAVGSALVYLGIRRVAAAMQSAAPAAPGGGEGARGAAAAAPPPPATAPKKVEAKKTEIRLIEKTEIAVKDREAVAKKISEIMEALYNEVLSYTKPRIDTHKKETNMLSNDMLPHLRWEGDKGQRKLQEKLQEWATVPDSQNEMLGGTSTAVQQMLVPTLSEILKDLCNVTMPRHIHSQISSQQTSDSIKTQMNKIISIAGLEAQEVDS